MANATGLVYIVFLCILQSSICKEITASYHILVSKLERLENIYTTLEKQLEETRNGLEYLYNDTKNIDLTQHTQEERTRSVESINIRDTTNRTASRDIVTLSTTLTTNAATVPPITTPRITNPVLFHSILTNSFFVMSPRQIIIFNSVKTNVGGAYDSHFGVFKAPVSGLYEFIATVSAYNDNYVDVEMVRNNYMLCRAHAASPSMEVGTCVAIVQLTTGDDVFVRHYIGHGTYLYGGYEFPSFSGHLISED